MKPKTISYADALEYVEASDLESLRAALRQSPALARAQGEDGDTLLHWACHHKNLPLAELLLDNGADPNARGFTGRTALHAAVNDSSADRALPIVRRLLASGADPKIENDDGLSAIDWARQEVWAPSDEVLVALRAVPLSHPILEPTDPSDFEATASRIRAIESRFGRR